MYKKIEGIIISEYPIEESSKIINIFTSDGIVGVVAKGAKKIKSPFFATTNKLCYGIFDIVYNKLFVVAQQVFINKSCILNVNLTWSKSC